MLNDSAKLNQEPLDISAETTVKLDQIKVELHPYLEPRMGK